MKCVRITTTMKMGLAAVATITMNTVPSVGMSRNTSTAMTKRAAAAKLILMKDMVMLNVAADMSTTTNISMAKAVAVGNITMNTKKAAAADMNIITATTFRVTRRTVSVKSAIRTKNIVTCAEKALKTAPAVCRTLTA